MEQIINVSGKEYKITSDKTLSNLQLTETIRQIEMGSCSSCKDSIKTLTPSCTTLTIGALQDMVITVGGFVMETSNVLDTYKEFTSCSPDFTTDIGTYQVAIYISFTKTNWPVSGRNVTFNVKYKVNGVLKTFSETSTIDYLETSEVIADPNIKYEANKTYSDITVTASW